MKKLGKTSREILILLYKCEEAYRSGVLKAPIATREMMRRVLVDGYLDAYRAAAGAEPLLYIKMAESRRKVVEDSLKSLLKRGLVKYVIARVDGELIKGYVLSDEGRRAAWMMRERALMKNDLKETVKVRESVIDRESEVKEALKALWEKGLYIVMLDEIYEQLWKNGGWRSREEFEAYWSKMKLARILKNLNVKRVRKRNNGKPRRLYLLPNPSQEAAKHNTNHLNGRSYLGG